MGDLTQEQHRSNVEKMLEQGGILPGLPDGPRLARFNAAELAAAIEKELDRCKWIGWTKLTITLDVEDAHALLRFLKRP